MIPLFDMLVPNRTAIWIAAFAVALSACSTGAGDGRVWGSLSLPSCDIETNDYDMDVSFFAASYYNGTLTIRIKNTGRDPTLCDGIDIMVNDVEAATSSLGEPQEILTEPSVDSFLETGPSQGVPKTSPDSPVRVTLYLNHTCPENLYGFSTAVGTVTFESIYVPDKEKRVTGKLSQLDFLSAMEPRDDNLLQIRNFQKFGFTRKAVALLLLLQGSCLAAVGVSEE